MDLENAKTQDGDLIEKSYQGEKPFLKKASLFRRFNIKKTFIWAVIISISFMLSVLLISAIWDYYANYRLEKKLSEIKARGEILTINDIQAKHIKDLASIKGSNGAHYYNAAFELIENQDWEKIENLPFVGKFELTQGVNKLDSELLLESEKYLKTLEDFFVLIEKAQGMRGCIFKQNYQEKWGMEMSHLEKIAYTARILLLKSCVESNKGNYDEAFHFIALGFKLIQSIEKDEAFVSKMSRAKIQYMFFAQLEKQLSTSPISESNIISLQNIIIENKRNGVQIGLTFENAVMIDLYSTILSGNYEFINFFKSDSRMLTFLKSNLAMYLMRGSIKDQFIKTINFMDEIRIYSELPLREATQKINEVLPRIKAENQYRGIFYQSFHVINMYADQSQVFALIFNGQKNAYERLEILEAVLAIELFRIKTGSYPAEFNQIVPEYIYEIPEDYFSVGKLNYQKDENGYYIYSNSSSRSPKINHVIDGKTILFRVKN